MFAVWISIKPQSKMGNSQGIILWPGVFLNQPYMILKLEVSQYLADCFFTQFVGKVVFSIFILDTTILLLKRCITSFQVLDITGQLTYIYYFVTFCCLVRLEARQLLVYFSNLYYIQICYDSYLCKGFVFLIHYRYVYLDNLYNIDLRSW